VNTTAFDIDTKVVDQFRNVPIVAIPDVLSSPRKRRISVDGIVKEVYFKLQMIYRQTD